LVSWVVCKLKGKGICIHMIPAKQASFLVKGNRLPKMSNNLFLCPSKIPNPPRATFWLTQALQGK